MSSELQTYQYSPHQGGLVFFIWHSLLVFSSYVDDLYELPKSHQETEMSWLPSTPVKGNADQRCDKLRPSLPLVNQAPLWIY